MAPSDEHDHRPRAVDCVIADDAEAIRQVTRTALESLGWIQVVGEAADGLEALEVIERLQPDVALLDVRMPHLSGFAVARRLRERGVGTRVVLFSAFASDANASQAAALDAEYACKDGGLSGLREALDRVRSTLPGSDD